MAWSLQSREVSILGLGLMAAATAGLVVGARAALRPFWQTSEILPKQPKTQYITQETEDSLPLETLSSLVGHYNYAIRETAVKIVCDRAINDDAALARLLWGVARPNYDERTRNLHALFMLVDKKTLHRLNTREAYAAFVQALEHCLVDCGYAGHGGHGYEMVDDPFYDEYYMRDISEKMCLMFLRDLNAKFGVENLVRAGFVERWLAHQRWVPTSSNASGSGSGSGNSPEDPSSSGRRDGDVQKRIDSFARYVKHRNNCITYICKRLRQSPIGLEALRRAQLVAPPRRHEDHDGLLLHIDARQAQQDQDHQSVPHASSPLRLQLRVNGSVESSELPPADGDDEEAPVAGTTRAVLGVLGDDDGDTVAAAGDATDATPDAPSSAAAAAAALQPRPPSQNTREEQRIRRQHREAMVLNDGTRPLRRADIIERESD